MTTELYYLTLTAVLSAVLWIPYAVVFARARGPLTAQDYKTLPNSDLPDGVKRAHRAHLNSLEVLPTFAVLVLVAHLAGQNDWITALAATVFFWARVAYTIVFFMGVPFVRTALFMVGVISQLAIFVSIIM